MTSHDARGLMLMHTWRDICILNMRHTISEQWCQSTRGPSYYHLLITVFRKMAVKIYLLWICMKLQRRQAYISITVYHLLVIVECWYVNYTLGVMTYRVSSIGTRVLDGFVWSTSTILFKYLGNVLSSYTFTLWRSSKVWSVYLTM